MSCRATVRVPLRYRPLSRQRKRRDELVEQIRAAHVHMGNAGVVAGIRDAGGTPAL